MMRVYWCVKKRPQPHGIVTLSDPAVIFMVTGNAR